MDQSSGEGAVDAALLGQLVDPGARSILQADDAWEAHRAALEICSRVLEHDLPRGGGMYVAWAELTDVFETGKTPIGDAHAALRRAAAEWLDRAGPPSSQHVKRWITFASSEVTFLYGRDGNFWSDPRA